MAGMSKMAIAACVLLLATFLQAQNTVRASFHDSLGELARANSLVQLETLWSHSPHDYPHRAIHAAMHLRLGGPNPDTMLVRAMPADGSEMAALYKAQDTKQGQDMAVTEAYSAYYTNLADAVGRDPERLPQFLKMIHAFNFVDIVDEWPWLCGLASNIYDAHPDAYISAAKKLGPKFRQEALDCKEPPDAP
jgi:hypothetical protein